MGNLPPAPGDGPTASSMSWAPPFPGPPRLRSRPWPAVVLAAIATAVSIAALVIALTRHSSESPAAKSTAPSYSGAEVSGAQQQLCDTYKLVAKAVQADTNGDNPALARIATTNGAVMLDNVAGNPALDAAHRDAARALAATYLRTTAMGNRDVATDSDFRAALDDLIAKDAVMKRVCGG